MDDECAQEKNSTISSMSPEKNYLSSTGQAGKESSSPPSFYSNYPQSMALIMQDMAYIEEFNLLDCKKQLSFKETVNYEIGIEEFMMKCTPDPFASCV